MGYVLACLAIFLAGYLLNMFYITVFYHRGLTHGAVKLRPWTRQWVRITGNWVTGLDPKAWSCMHRMHHLYSDTPNNPHSPRHNGLASLMLVQLRSYNRVLRRLICGAERESQLVDDLDFSVSWLNRRHLWALPYLLHAAIGLGIGWGFHMWWLGLAYWLGIMSHPIQGWMVNALAHRFGYTNFDNSDQSKNNLVVAALVFGEGYQNNHHHAPQSADFGVRAWEIDMGYWLCLMAQRLGMLTVERRETMRAPTRTVVARA